MKPSEVVLTDTPLADTTGKVESEHAAALIVRACQVFGDQWQPIVPGKLAQVLRDDVAACREPFATLAKNPFFRPDLHRLVEGGFARWTREEVLPATPIELTEEMLRRVSEKWARPASPLFGLWKGGRHPGWCSFRTSREVPDLTLNGRPHAYGYAGTLDEAKEGRAQFLTEGNAPEDYAVVVFDAAREPPASDLAATPAQLAFLRSVARLANFPHPLPPNWRATSDAIFQRGWITHHVDAWGREIPRRPLRLTAAGRAFQLREWLRRWPHLLELVRACAAETA